MLVARIALHLQSSMHLFMALLLCLQPMRDSANEDDPSFRLVQQPGAVNTDDAQIGASNATWRQGSTE